MRKYPIDLQDEEKACGAYCISMILKFYGYQDEMKKIKQKARLNQNGISILGIIECLKTYQIEAKAYQATFADEPRRYICCDRHQECEYILHCFTPSPVDYGVNRKASIS